jgi:lipopolysaccharide transport system permease protein
MVVFTLVLGRVARAADAAVPYPLFAFCGLVAWNFFAGAITSAGGSVVGNQNLVTKVYFPRLIVPMGAVGATAVDFLVAFGMLLALMLVFGVAPSGGLLLVPLLAFGLMVAALGVGTLLAALTVAYRDFRHAVPFLVQLWMFATPSIYLQAEGVVGSTGRMLLLLNPANGLIANFRAAVLGTPYDFPALGASLAVSLTLLAAGCLYFRQVERDFADII